MSELKLHRIGMLMEPEPGNPNEVEGVLNPAAARGLDGQLYLFPRMVAKGNFSRIGLSRVIFNSDGDPSGVERLGVAIEPEAEYERRPDGGGGCEDPRITFVETLGYYVMAYTALSPAGPRVALAISKDLLSWERIGLASFEPFEGIEFEGVDNKDASLFPTAVPNPFGELSLAILHRPLFPGTNPEDKAKNRDFGVRDMHRESIWISCRPMSANGGELSHLHHFTSHHRLATPISPWENLKIGGGTPPILCKHGWLIAYHGVSELPGSKSNSHPLRYSAGIMVLEKDHPGVVKYRSAKPVLTPELPEECHGTIANVVFPTGIDRRDDLGKPDRYDIYYGMADDRIGVARLDMPDQLPEQEEDRDLEQASIVESRTTAFGR